MKLGTKRWLDTAVGWPAVLVLNGLARALGLLLRRDHALEPGERILVMKFQGLGSLAIALPALRRLRAEYPERTLIFWGTPATCLLARECGLFDQVLTLDDHSLASTLRSLAGALGQLLTRRVDTAFDLEVYSKLSTVLLTLICARNRLGFAVDRVPLRKGLHTHLYMFNRYLYLGTVYEGLFALVFPPRTPNPPDARPPVAGPRPYDLLVNAHCGPLAFERLWPEAHFTELLAKLAAAYPEMKIGLLGHGPEEKARNARILAGLPAGHAVHDLVDRLKLGETLHALAAARLVVTGDTAALHLALLGPAPVLALFGPTRGETYLPPDRPATLCLQVAVACSPCVHHWEPPPCRGDNVCLKWLSPAAVFEGARRLLGDPPAATEFRRLTPTPPPAGGYRPGVVVSR